MYQDSDYLSDIIRCRERIVEKTQNRQLDEFLDTEDLHDIVVRQFTVIGEAARKLSDDAKGRYPEIPWHRVTGMRNRLVHDYKGIDLNEVWETIQIDIPELLRQLKR